MKRMRIIPFILLISLAFVGCKNKPKTLPVQNEFLRPASMSYTKEDTTNINDLVNIYVENMRARNFEANADLLYFVRNDSAIAYSDGQKKDYVDAWSHMDFYNLKVNTLLLRSAKNNEVQIMMQIIKSGDLEKGIGVTSFYLNPVKIGDKWYLTLLDKNAEGVEDVYKVEK